MFGVAGRAPVIVSEQMWLYRNWNRLSYCW